MPENETRRRIAEALVAQSPMAAQRYGIPQQLTSLLSSLSMVPLPSEEAVAEPVIGPETYGVQGAAKGLASHAWPALALMKANPYKPRVPYLPPGKEPVDAFIPHNGAQLMTGDQIMRQGKDPWLGYDRLFAPADGTLDYLPRGVNTSDKAARYLQQWVGRNTLNPYEVADDGMQVTPRFWNARDK